MKTKFSDIFDVMKNEYETNGGAELLADSVDEKKLQAIASELYGVSCYGDFILKQAFVQTATGEYLDRHGELRGLERKSGAYASGTLTFGISEASSEDITIEKGTFCSSENNTLIQFYTTADVILKAGETSVDAAAVSSDIGEKFNVKAGEITVLVNAPAGIESVTNTEAFTGGTDSEEDGAFRQRIMENYRLPSNGYSKSYTENKIKALDFIIDCCIKDSDETGIINAVIATNSEITDEYKEEILSCISFSELFGYDVNIIIAEKTAVDITVNIYLSSADDADEDEITSVLTQILNRKKIGEDIALDELREAIFEASNGVKSVEFGCPLIKNDVIQSQPGGYLYLNSLEVNLYEK